MTRVHIAPETTEASASRRSAGGSRRGLLWLLLVISASCNLVASVAGVSALVGSAFGLVAVCCGAALVSDHYRNRRR